MAIGSQNIAKPFTGVILRSI